jgi:hypothetical protein
MKITKCYEKLLKIIGIIKVYETPKKLQDEIAKN